MTLAWIAHTFGHQRATVVLQDSSQVACLHIHIH